jgi:hypothetical protein
MSILREMYANTQFQSDWEYKELHRMLSDAVENGFVEKVRVIKRNRYFRGEQWFRDKETGEIYSLIEPEERIRGRWARVDLEKYS